MRRSSLLNALIRIAAATDRAQHPPDPPGSVGPKLGRRAVVVGIAGAAGAALLPRLPALAASEARVAIVGAGLAGLNAAYELSKAGLKSTVYEGSTRLGGRCYTIRSFPGQIAEHGGEFIDSGHEAIRGLCAALSLELDDVLAAESRNSTSLYAFGDGYSVASAQKDYAALHPLIQDQAKRIGEVSYKASKHLLERSTTSPWPIGSPVMCPAAASANSGS